MLFTEKVPEMHEIDLVLCWEYVWEMAHSIPMGEY